MEQHTDTVPTGLPPVRLRVLADELETTPAELEKRLGDDAFTDAIGFRVCTAFRASRLLEEHRRKLAEAEAEAQRASEEAQARREAQRARAIAARKDTSSRVQQYGLQTVVINPNADGILPVAKMTANADLDFGDGTPSTRRPSRIDWLTGKNLEGGTFGPAPKRNKKGKDPK